MSKVFPIVVQMPQQPGSIIDDLRRINDAERRYDRALLSTPLRIGAAEPADLQHAWVRRVFGDRTATRLGADARATGKP